MEPDRPYLDAAHRVLALVTAADADDGSALTRPVAACPGWSVHDTLAHLVGLAEDVAAGNLEGYGSEPVTAEHVSRGAGQPVTTLGQRWEAVLPRMEAVLADPAAASVPPAIATLCLFDLIVHEHDIRHALGRPGGRDSAGAQRVLALTLRRLDRAFAAIGKPLEVELDDGPHLLGGNEGDAPARLAVSSFELWRAGVGRRSRAQVEAWAWSAGPEPWIDLLVPPPPPGGGRAPVSWPATPIEE